MDPGSLYGKTDHKTVPLQKNCLVKSSGDVPGMWSQCECLDFDHEDKILNCRGLKIFGQISCLNSTSCVIKSWFHLWTITSHA